jgi:hypothetical protein
MITIDLLKEEVSMKVLNNTINCMLIIYVGKRPYYTKRRAQSVEPPFF